MKEKCDCADCGFRGMELCDYRRYIDAIASLRMQIKLNNLLLGDIAGRLYDKDMHQEEDEVLELMCNNKSILESTQLDGFK